MPKNSSEKDSFDSKLYNLMQNFKGKSKKPLLPTIIVDDFFELPQLVRAYALSLEYYKGDRGTWPGLRSNMIQELDEDLFNTVENKLLDAVGVFKSFSKSDMTFQIISEHYGSGWVHDDNPEHDLAGVIYLNDVTVQGSGTVIYDQQLDVNMQKYTEIFRQDVNSEEKNIDFEKHRQEQKSHFRPNITAESRMNRCIMFDPRQWHSAEGFFGKDKTDSRMTLVFFCNGVYK